VLTSLHRTADPHPPSCSYFPPCPEFQYPSRYNHLFNNWSVSATRPPLKHSANKAQPLHTSLHRLSPVLAVHWTCSRVCTAQYIYKIIIQDARPEMVSLDVSLRLKKHEIEGTELYLRLPPCTLFLLFVSISERYRSHIRHLMTHRRKVGSVTLL